MRDAPARVRRLTCAILLAGFASAAVIYAVNARPGAGNYELDEWTTDGGYTPPEDLDLDQLCEEYEEYYAYLDRLVRAEYAEVRALGE